VTFRCEAHSTSDDPAQYRAEGEGQCWPGGDPVERLKRHLVQIGEWSEESHQQLDKALEQEVSATFEHAESYGSLAEAGDQPAANLFDDVFATVPARLQEQLRELEAETAREEPDVGATVPFTNAVRRAVG
jgi:2-oxoisovalerate dehydrogenase E1 component alpha subunit